MFEPLASGDAPPRLQQLMLDRLAQPQFWVAALTIATRQHAQPANTVELEAGAESLATGEQVIQWYGRAGPGDWPLHRLQVHIPVAAMAYLCANAPPSAQGGEVSLKGVVQTVRGMRFVNAGGLRSLYEPPCFTEVEPFRLQLLQRLQNQQGLTHDVQEYCGLIG